MRLTKHRDEYPGDDGRRYDTTDICTQGLWHDDCRWVSRCCNFLDNFGCRWYTTDAGNADHRVELAPRGKIQNVAAENTAQSGYQPVSYTHLTLPTSDLV